MSSEDEEETLATTRQRRANAGSKMSQLLDAEETDDFYKTTYGGFDDEVDDNDYFTEDSDSDVADSDFSIDEFDEPLSDDNEDDDTRRKRLRKGVYREPKRTDNNKTADDVVKSSGRSSVRSGGNRQQTQSQSHATQPPIIRVISKKSFRESTKRKAKEVELRAKVAKRETEARRKQLAKTHIHYRELTQKEMLKEAKKTEIINLKSLERYRQLELENSKKSKIVKDVPKGPMIRYQSVTMPALIQEMDTNDEKQSSEQVGEQNIVKREEKCARTFISFTDELAYSQYFPERLAPVAKTKLLCPITYLPARYLDPVSLLPYSSAKSFKVIRETYYNKLEQLGDRNQPEVANWLSWRQKKAQRNDQLIHNKFITSKIIFMK